MVVTPSMLISQAEMVKRAEAHTLDRKSLTDTNTDIENIKPITIMIVLENSTRSKAHEFIHYMEV